MWGICLFYPEWLFPKRIDLYPEGHIFGRTSRSLSSSRAPKEKRAKSPPKRADRIWRDLCRGESPLNFRLNPVRPAPDPALKAKQKPNQAPPSLGAKYPGLLKSCQEKTTGLPQNMEYQLSKASIRSGACAELAMDLREGNHAKEEGAMTSFGMRYISIPWSCAHPTSDLVAQFLTLLRENPGRRVFVHCHAGIDGTGLMIAAYRMSVQSWTPQQAMAEMRSFGFSSFHSMVAAGFRLSRQLSQSSMARIRLFRARAWPPLLPLLKSKNERFRFRCAPPAPVFNEET